MHNCKCHIEWGIVDGTLLNRITSDAECSGETHEEKKKNSLREFLLELLKAGYSFALYNESLLLIVEPGAGDGYELDILSVEEFASKYVNSTQDYSSCRVLPYIPKKARVGGYNYKERNIYYDPEVCGLKRIGLLGGSLCWKYNSLLVVRHTKSGRLFWAQDSNGGMPFELERFVSPDDTSLIEITNDSLGEFRRAVFNCPAPVSRDAREMLIAIVEASLRR